MEYERILDKEFDLVRDCKDQADRMRRAASRLTAALADLLNSEYPVEAWGTTFTPDEDGIGAEFKSPFGEARVVVSIGLGSEGVQARYSFEKKFTDEHDKPSFTPVWAVRVTARALVRPYKGDEVLLDLNAHSENERDRGAIEIALSALYAIANCEKY